MTETPVKPRPIYLEAELAPVDEEAWEVAGLLVPFGEVMDRPHWESGAARQRIDGATMAEGSQLFYGHDHLGNGLPIGLIVETKPTEAGLWGRARISKTAKGTEVRTLLLDKVLTKFSIGFLDDVWHVEEDGTLAVHDNVNGFEVSIVPRPQYDSAAIESVLHDQPTTPAKETHTMTETLVTPEALAALQADLTAHGEHLSTIERQITTLGTPGTMDGPPVVVPGDSFGEFLQLLTAKGGPDPEAAEFLAYVGGVTGDFGDWVKDTWVGDIIRVVDKPRHAMNFFQSAPLPATGMGVEYGMIDADTTAVAKQAAEGDVLAYGKITLKTDTAELDTYGGWGEMTFQQIQRLPIPVIQRFFEALARRYGVTTEGAVRAKLQTATGAHSVAATDLTTADGWIDFMVEGAAHLDGKGLTPEALFVSKDVFKDLAKLRDGDATDAPRLLNRDSGQISVKGLSGNMFNVEVKMLGTLAADTVRLAAPEAIKTFESPGAPFRLQDEDITNLTTAASVYGYLAVAEQEPDAIVVPGV